MDSKTDFSEIEMLLSATEEEQGERLTCVVISAISAILLLSGSTTLCLSGSSLADYVGIILLIIGIATSMASCILCERGAKWLALGALSCVALPPLALLIALWLDGGTFVRW